MQTPTSRKQSVPPGITAATTHFSERDLLISQAEAKRLAGGISSMSCWRWRKAGLIPDPYSIRGRNYWRRGEFLDALAKLTKAAEAE